LDITNQSKDPIPEVEIVVVCVNSGVFVTEQGQSSTYTAVLNKESVFATTQAKAISSAHVQSLVGGKLLAGGSSALGKHLRDMKGGSDFSSSAQGQRMSGGGRAGLQGLY